jgi:hypothetical protein
MNLKSGGGVWFECNDFQIHIGIEDSFVPAKKAHPAFEVQNLRELKAKLTEKKVSFLEDDQLPGANRIFIMDPFGNRIELLEWKKK